MMIVIEYNWRFLYFNTDHYKCNIFQMFLPPFCVHNCKFILKAEHMCVVHKDAI